jgi:hypothetical protein
MHSVCIFGSHVTVDNTKALSVKKLRQLPHPKLYFVIIRLIYVSTQIL